MNYSSVKKYCLSKLILLFSVCAAFSQALVYESFNYANGPINGLNGGAGFADVWTVGGSDMNPFGYAITTSSPMNFANLSSLGTAFAMGGSATGTNLFAGRTLDLSLFSGFTTNNSDGKLVIGAANKTVYFSTLMRFNAVSPTNSHMITLHNNPTPQTGAGSFRFLDIGVINGTNTSPNWSIRTDNVVYSSTKPVVLGETVLAVAKIEFTNTLNQAIISVFFNPTVDGIEPTIPNIGPLTINYSLTSRFGFNKLAYVSGVFANGVNSINLDEIRLATTYPAAVPPVTVSSDMLIVSNSNYSFPNVGGISLLTINSNINWSASTSGVVTVNPSSGGSGISVVTLTAPINSGSSTITDNITIIGNALRRVVNYSIAADLPSGTLAYEGFDYPAAAMTATNLNGGVGFSGPWTQFDSGNGLFYNNFQIRNTNASAQITGLISNGRYMTGGSYAPSPFNDEAVIRNFDLTSSQFAPFTTTSAIHGAYVGKPGTTIYISGILNKPNQWREQEISYTLYNGNSPHDGTNRLVEFGYIGSTSPQNGPYKIDLRTGLNTTGSSNTVNIAQNTPFLYVLKVEFGATQHTFTGYVNPALNGNEPSSPSVGPFVTTFNENMGGFSKIAFQMGNEFATQSANGSGLVDEIRLGTSYASVTPFIFIEQLTASPTGLTYPYQGGIRLVTVNSNIAWSVSNQGFASIVPLSGTAGISVLTVSAPIKNGNTELFGSFSVTGTTVQRIIAYSSIPQTIALPDMLLAYEGFNYGVTTFTATNLNGGIGFSTPWTAHNGGFGTFYERYRVFSSNESNAINGLVAQDGYFSGGAYTPSPIDGQAIVRTLNMTSTGFANYTVASTAFGRYLGKPGTVMYVSGILNKTQEWSNEDISFTLYNGTNPHNLANRLVEFGYLSNTSPNNGPFKMDIRTGNNTTGSVNTVSVAKNTPNLYVLKVQFGFTEHTFTGFVNPTLNGEEPTNPSVGPFVSSFNDNSGGFTNIAFQVGTVDATASTNGSGLVDEIRFGTTYRQVAPIPFVSLSPATLTFPQAGGVQLLTVSSNVSWNLNLPNGYSSSSTTGVGNAIVSITGLANNTVFTSSGIIEITSNSLTATSTIFQQAIPATLSLASASSTVSGLGESKSFTITSNAPWSILLPQGVTSNTTTGFGNASISLVISQNSRTTPINLIVTVNGLTSTEYLTFNQEGGPEVLFVTQNNVAFTANPSTIILSVTSNINWTLADSNPYFTLNTTSGFGNGLVSITVPDNQSVNSFSGILTLTGSTITRIISLTQEALIPSLSVSTANAHFSYSGGIYLLTINGNTHWQAATQGNRFLLSSVVGFKNYVLTITAAKHLTSNSFADVLIITSAGITQSVNLTQAAFSPVLSVPSSNVGFNSFGGSFGLIITANEDWVINRSSSIFTISTMSGVGNKTVGISINTNPTANVRTEVITITSHGLSVIMNFTQSGSTLQFSISNSALSFTGMGGSKTLNVISNAPWTISGLSENYSATPTYGTSSAVVTITAGMYVGLTKRGESLSFKALSSSLSLELSQLALDPILEVSSNELSVPQVGGAVTLTISSNFAWNIVADESFTVSTFLGQDNRIIVTLTLPENLELTKTFDIAFTGIIGFSKSITITQFGITNIINKIDSFSEWWFENQNQSLYAFKYPVNVSIYNTLGNKVLDFSLTEPTIINLPSGVYIVKTEYKVGKIILR